VTDTQQGTEATAAGVPTRPAGMFGSVGVARLRDFTLVPAIVAIMIVGYFVNPVFLHRDNLINVLQQQSEVSLIVLAEALVLIAGRMDLSLESTFGLAPGVAAWLTVSPGLGHGLGWLGGFWAVPVTLAVGAVIGLVNALLIVRFRLNGFIVTLGMLITVRGLLNGISKGKTFFNLTGSQNYLGNAQWLGLPAAVWLSLLLFAGAIVVMGYTRFGRSLYAIGGNPDAARAAGIRVERILTITLVAASMLAAFGGMLQSGRLGSVASSQGNGKIFTVFAAAVIGGVSLNGGKGTIFGAFTGILLLYLVQNVLQLGSVPPEWLDALNGGIILLALIVSRITSGKAQE
jgi:simple sugar transport system permease protein